MLAIIIGSTWATLTIHFLTVERTPDTIMKISEHIIFILATIASLQQGMDSTLILYLELDRLQVLGVMWTKYEDSRLGIIVMWTTWHQEDKQSMGLPETTFFNISPSGPTFQSCFCILLPLHLFLRFFFLLSQTWPYFDRSITMNIKCLWQLSLLTSLPYNHHQEQ